MNKSLFVLTDAGHIDFPATYAAYGAAGKPRQELLAQMWAKIAAVLPELNDAQLEVQIRLAANAIFAEYRQKPYRRREAFPRKG